MWIGESFVGSGANVAHINVFVGPRDGPVGAAQVACMRKLLTILNALMRDRAVWRCPHVLTP